MNLFEQEVKVETAPLAVPKGLPTLKDSDLKGFFDEEQEEENPEEEIEEEFSTEEVEVEQEEEPEQEDEFSQEEEATEEEEESEQEPSISYADVVEVFQEAGILDFDPEKEFTEDSPEILEEAIHYTIEKGKREMFESLPDDLKRAITLYQENQDYTLPFKTETFDYSKADLEDEDTAITLIYEDMQSNGFSEEEIDERLESILESEKVRPGFLQREAKVAQKKLVVQQEQEREQEKVRQQQKEEKAQKQVQEFWSEIKNNIYQKEEILGFNLSKTEKEQFFDYIHKPVKKGKTQFQLDQEADKEADIKTAFMYFRKFDVKEVEKKVETEITKKINKVFSNFQDKNITKKNQKSQSTKKGEEIPKAWWLS